MKLRGVCQPAYSPHPSETMVKTGLCPRGSLDIKPGSANGARKGHPAPGSLACVPTWHAILNSPTRTPPTPKLYGLLAFHANELNPWSFYNQNPCYSRRSNMKEEKVLVVIWALGLFIPMIYFTNIRGGSEKHSRARGSRWCERSRNKGKTYIHGPLSPCC